MAKYSERLYNNPLSSFKQASRSILTLSPVTFVNIEDPYESDSLSVLSWDAVEGNQAVSQYVEDETTKSQYDGEHETSHGGSIIPAHFSAASDEDEDEEPTVFGSATAVHDGLLAMRLLRHFKEGPGQW